MEADGSNQTRLTTGNDGAPVWSPDGCRIVFRRGLGEIHVMDRDGAHQTLVARTSGDNPEFDLRSYFSPDGSRILLHSSGLGSQHRNLFVVNADGSGLVNLTNKTGRTTASWPSWSPDGSQILFESRREVYIMHANGTGVRRLSAGASPAWSPDGTKIGFIAAEPGNREIVVMNADGTNVTPLTDGPRMVMRFSWSPDGSRIAFETVGPNDVSLLEVLNADGAERRTLAGEVWFVMRGARPVSWSSDGSRIVFTRTGAHGVDIHVVDADATNLTRLTNGGVSYEPAWSPTASCHQGS
jgi:TolB protein